jgi:lipopolysaccharide cholinephosphotransferase
MDETESELVIEINDKVKDLLNEYKYVILLILIILIGIGFYIYVKNLNNISYYLGQEKKEFTKEDYEYIHKVLLENIKKTIKIFEKHNIKYWADGGTLLGSIRDNKIIDYDDDIDIGLLGEDFIRLMNNENNILEDFDKMNLHLTKYEDSKLGIIKILTKSNDYKKDKIFIDIMSYEIVNNKYVLSNKKARKKWPNFYFNDNELFPIKKGKLNDISINIPNNPIKFLERGYGNCSNEKCWKIPNNSPGHHYKEINLTNQLSNDPL